MTRSGLDPDQLRQLVIRPTLKELDLWSPAAESLVLGTGIHESRLVYLDQIDKLNRPGPAFGLFQMEAFTHNDIWRTTLFGKYLGARVGRMLPAFQGIAPDPQNLVWNLKYAAAMCRVHYRRIKEPLPDNEPHALAAYWKKYYNTALGAGSVEQALPAFYYAVNGETA